MMKRIVFLAGLVQLSLFAATPCVSQDSARVLILSPRVGAKITAAAREQFHLFPQFHNFVEATVWQAADGSCFVKITVEPSPGVFRDTVVQYGRRTLQLMAEKVDHFEELEAGAYRIGDRPAHLLATDGESALETRAPAPDSLGFESRALEQAREWHDNGPSRDNLTVKLSTGLSLRGKLMDDVSDSSFAFESNREVHFIPVNSLESILRHRESRFWTGAGIGVVVGAALGGIIGYATYSKPQRKPGEWFVLDFGPGLNTAAGAIVGVPIGFAIGGTIGASMGGDDVINMSGTGYQVKLMIIRMVISGGEDKTH